MLIEERDLQRIRKYFKPLKEFGMEEKILEVTTKSGKINLSEIVRERVSKEDEDRHVRGND